MKLADLPLRCRRPRSPAIRRPTAARSSRAFCSSPLPAPRPTARISPGRRPRPARWRSSPSSGRTGCPTTSPSCGSKNARRALALRRGEILSAPAGNHRRRHRHQRQDFGRRVHAPDLDARSGMPAASIGTIGVVSPKGETYGSLTTPDPVELHRTLDQLAGEGVTHLALEASSHGLDQHRLDGVRIAAGAFTNLSRDHLDYHPTIEAYLAAKLRLFDDADRAGRHGGDRRRRLLCRAGGRGGAEARPQGDDGRRAGDDIRLARRRDRRLRAGRQHRAWRPDLQGEAAAGRRLPGAERAVAAGLAIATGGEPRAVFAGAGEAATAPRAGWNWSARATARRFSSTTRTSPTRWRRRSRRCGLMPAAG